MVNGVLSAFRDINSLVSHNTHVDYHFTDEEIKTKSSILDLTLHPFPQVHYLYRAWKYLVLT